MQSGLVAVFGPQADATANHIQSISDTFHIPHVESRWHYSSDSKPLSINVRPHPSVLGQVWGWTVQTHCTLPGCVNKNLPRIICASLRSPVNVPSTDY